MAKEKEAKEEANMGIDSRQEAWNQLVEMYREENPRKYEVKKANGEFDRIPVGFKGKVGVSAKGKKTIE